jgi:hypothetical protein
MKCVLMRDETELVACLNVGREVVDVESVFGN